MGGGVVPHRGETMCLMLKIRVFHTALLHHYPHLASLPLLAVQVSVLPKLKDDVSEIMYFHVNGLY